MDREVLAAGQTPFAAILRCADSRVAPEIVFDQPLGALFVCGVAGNVATEEIIGSLEYAVDALGCRAIIVMGHASCGVIAAAMSTEIQDGHMATLLNGIVIKGIDDAACAAHNAVHQAAEISRRSEPIAVAVTDGDIRLAAGVFDIASGRFTFCDREAPPQGGM